MDSASVELGRSVNAGIALVAAICGGVVLVLVAVVPMPASQEPGRPWAVLIFGVVFLVPLLAFRRLRRRWRVVIDQSGVNVYVGNRVTKSLGWPEVGMLQTGLSSYSVGRFKPATGDYFLFFDRRRRVVVRVNGALNLAAPGDIRNAADVAASIAKAKGVQVVSKDSRF